MDQPDSVYYTSRGDKPRRIHAPHQRDKETYGERKQTWRNGRSKPHKIECKQCGGIVHERGRHLQPGVVRLMQAKREREAARAAACGYEPGGKVQQGLGTS